MCGVEPLHHPVEVLQLEGLESVAEEPEEGARRDVKAGHDPGKGWSCSACGPVQVAVLVGVGAHEFAISSDDIDRDDALGRPSPSTLVPALAALEQEAADSDGGAVAAIE